MQLQTQTPTTFDWHSANDLTKLAAILCAGGVCGVFAMILQMPLPFMLGGLIGSICITGLANRRGVAMPFPKVMRMFFVGLIGTMIGGTFTPQVVSAIPGMTLTLIGVVLYIVLAQSTGYLICRYVGRYDKVTAFYASMPGGLIEAIELGERGGGNVKTITQSHFLRVTFVVVSIPLLFWLISGGPVGSSAGESFDKGQTGAGDVGLLCVITVIGLCLGRILHVPAAHLLGPVLVSAVAHGGGFVDLSSPTWLLFLAQLIVGAGLGTQFSGAGGRSFRRVLITTILATCAMLILSAVIAIVFSHWSDLGRDALFLSLAPGGVTEMGLIALSLGISPVMVAAHHVFRIFLTVSIAAASTRLFRSKNAGD